MGSCGVGVQDVAECDHAYSCRQDAYIKIPKTLFQHHESRTSEDIPLFIASSHVTLQIAADSWFSQIFIHPTPQWQLSRYSSFYLFRLGGAALVSKPHVLRANSFQTILVFLCILKGLDLPARGAWGDQQIVLCLSIFGANNLRKYAEVSFPLPCFA